MSGKRELYRNPERGKLGGVCAGVSDYFKTEKQEEREKTGKQKERGK